MESEENPGRDMEREGQPSWFALRDLKRPNCKEPAFRLLASAGFEVFTPLKWRVIRRGNRSVREEVPFIHDLLFVHSLRERLDPFISDIPTLQYRWLRHTFREPMTVPSTEMERFIRAVRATDSPKYYLPSEITPAMYGRRIRIIGGTLSGYEGGLVTVRGSKVRRLLVELPGFFAAGVEVEPEYIRLL